jgi:hypothetical protein
MWAFGMIPFAFFCLLACREAQKGAPLRDAVIKSGVLSLLWVAAGAELLSLFNALSFWPLLLWWGVPAIGIGRSCIRGPRVSLALLPQDKGARIALVAAGLLLGITFLVSALTPPNNADALTYHLPRQVYWMQQHSVANFPTSNWRALSMPPLTEFAGVQLLILSDDDRWLNLISWFALVLTAASAAAERSYWNN